MDDRELRIECVRLAMGMPDRQPASESVLDIARKIYGFVTVTGDAPESSAAAGVPITTDKQAP